MKGRVKNNRPAEVPGVSRKLDAASILPEVVYDLASILEDYLTSDFPDSRRVAIRDLKAKLQRAFPQLKLSETDLAQYLADEDGEAIDDAP